MFAPPLINSSIRRIYESRTVDFSQEDKVYLDSTSANAIDTRNGFHSLFGGVQVDSFATAMSQSHLH